MLRRPFPPCPEALIGASLQRVTTFAGLPQISSPSRGEKHPTFAPCAVSPWCPAAARGKGGLERKGILREVFHFPKNNSGEGTNSEQRSNFSLFNTEEERRVFYCSRPECLLPPGRFAFWRLLSSRRSGSAAPRAAPPVACRR